MITDLEEQVARVRDHRTRTYYSDAVRCFRAGAFRSAVTAAWVSVAYDIIAKYRELDTLGDAEARRFVLEWDQAIQGNQTAKLLEMERGILDHAHEKMAIIDIMTLRALKRLYEDRHSCAHPAFTTQDDLYDPPADLVRCHLSIAVEALLSQPPVQGRGIFERFSADIRSTGFPSSPSLIHDYVEQKYLRIMRPQVVRNFGIVLAKSAIRNVPPEWTMARSKVLNSLEAVQLRAAGNWPDVETEIIRLLNDDDPASRARAVVTLSAFPNLVARLAPATRIALQQTCGDAATVRGQPELFVAATLPDFRDVLVRQFEVLEDADAAAVLTVSAPAPLWSSALHRYGQSGSFRGAEARFDQFILPFVPTLSSENLNELFAVVEGNGQIWDAGGTPERISALLGSVAPHRPSHDSATSLYRHLHRWPRENYEEVWQQLEQSGWQRPAPRAVANDDPAA